MLGVQGAKDWQHGTDWRNNMRGWYGLSNPVTRLQGDVFESGLQISEQHVIIKSKQDEIMLQLHAEADLSKQTEKSLRKGIKSFELRILEHELKIKNPKNYDPAWETYTNGHKEGLLNHWRKEIKNFRVSIKNRQEELRKRGE